MKKERESVCVCVCMCEFECVMHEAMNGMIILVLLSQGYLQVAASGVPSRVVLTDGNALSVSNVKIALQHNTLPVQPASRYCTHPCHMRVSQTET